jgi:hypothetical protein
MRKTWASFATAALVLASCGPALAAYDAGEVAGFGSYSGPDGGRAILLEQGFVVTDETYRQICSFYIQQYGPAFITTDALLYAYYTNVEDAMLALEKRQGLKLAGIIQGLKRQLKAFRDGDDDSLKTMSKERKISRDWFKAADALGDYFDVADTLITGKTAPKDLEKMSPAVREEIKLILAAAGPAQSPTRGIPLDYSRFAPYGFYEDDKALAGYYRALTWFREVPFRVEDENEARQMMILFEVESRNTWDRYGGDYSNSVLRFNLPYTDALGPSDDVDFDSIDFHNVALNFHFGLSASDEDKWARAWRRIKEIPAPEYTTIPDPAAVADPAAYRGLRLLARPALADNAVFKALAPYGLARPVPSGEELMAVMGSAAAREIVFEREGAATPGYAKLFGEAGVALDGAEKELDAHFRDRQGYFRTYDYNLEGMRLELCRSLLAKPDDPTLPDYYLNPAWRYKDLNTCLAGWAHHRYIWAAHAKKSVYYLGVKDWPPGVIEPNVRFFDALLDLSVHTDGFFRRHGIDHKRFAELNALLADLRAILAKQLAGEELNGEENWILSNFGFELANVCGFRDNTALTDDILPDTSFCVPVSSDLYSGDELLVGQLRPRAIYVICEIDGKQYLTTGGVLTYAGHVVPAAGPGAMTEDAWRRAAVSGEIAPPAWQRRFYAGGEPEDFIGYLNRGILREGMFYKPTLAMGDVLVEKLVRGDEFAGSFQGIPFEDTEAAVYLLYLTGHPETRGVLIGRLKGSEPVSPRLRLSDWPVAAALEGKLTAEDAKAVMTWVEEGHPHADLLLELVATTPGEAAEELVLNYLDETEGRVNAGELRREWARATVGLLRRPGLGTSEKLLARLSTYEDFAWRSVQVNLSRKWSESTVDPITGAEVEREFSHEEREFVETLRDKTKATKSRGK